MNKDFVTKNSRMRTLVLFVLLYSFLVLVQYALVIFYANKSASPASSIELQETERGEILDRHGHLLATQIRQSRVEILRSDVIDVDRTATLLGEELGISPGFLKSRILDNDQTGWFIAKSKCNPTEAQNVANLIDSEAISGTFLYPVSGRNYPNSDMASHLIGFVNNENIGAAGIEYSFNELLSPQASLVGDGQKNGNRIYLTIDQNSQYITERVAKKAMEENQPDILTVLLMDAKTGEILSYVSLPQYNPNQYTKYPDIIYKNHPAKFAYEPGSVFKIFTMASFVELGVDTNSVYDTTGGYNPPIFQKYNIIPITDLTPNMGLLTLEEGIIFSSNVVLAYASEQAPVNEFYRMLTAFGFGNRTNLPLPGESKGILRQPSEWSIRTKPTIAFGQEIGVSAVQMVTAGTVLANAGTLLEPQIIKKVVTPQDKILVENFRTPVREVVSPSTARWTLEAMRKAVVAPGATVSRAHIPGLNMSAKSGTSQVFDSATGVYFDNKFVASVMGIFPTEDPKLILYVTMETPRGDSFYGGRVAAPILRQIAIELAPFYNIAIEGNSVISHTGEVSIAAIEPLVIGSQVPDLIGRSKQEILPLVASSQFVVQMEGSGWVVEQSPAPGTLITHGMTVLLRFDTP